MIYAPLTDVRSKVEQTIIQRRDQCIQDTVKKWKHDFYIIIQYLPKKKAEQKGVQINIAALEAIPTPTYDTTLFKYNYNTQQLDLLWSLPSEQYARNLYANKESVMPEDYPLLEQVVNYYDGTLFKMIAQWENSDGTVKREREHASRDLGKSGSTGDYQLLSGA